MHSLARELIRTGALEFGSFITKSGRTSPYFINTSKFYESTILRRIASEINKLLVKDTIADTDFFGPAYKGIALAAAACMQASDSMPQSRFAFFRKEAKKHGEGGLLVGSLRAGKPLVVIEDVLTGGTALRQTLEQLHTSSIDAEIKCVIVVIDRQEVGQKISAQKEVSKLYNCPCLSITNIDALINEIETWKEKPPGYNREAIDSYRKTYGS